MKQPTVERVYAFICAYIAQHHLPPTIREIADGCYLGSTAVHHHLKTLQAAGLIIREKGKARGIILPEAPPERR
jgi:repressor LexA